MSSFRDDAPPWSFFIPVTLAVIVGVLAADAIRYAISTVFGGEDAPQQVEAEPDDPPVATEQVAPEPQRQPQPQPQPDPRGAAVGDDADVAGVGPAAALPDDQGPPAPSETSRTDGVLELPSSMSARRDGDPAACVNGTVVNRVEGGWEQALEDDSPVPCVVVNR